MKQKTYQGAPNARRMSITIIPRLIRGFKHIRVTREKESNDTRRTNSNK